MDGWMDGWRRWVCDLVGSFLLYIEWVGGGGVDEIG